MDIDLFRIASQFDYKGDKILSIEPYGEGHINVTYKMVTSSANEYIFQKINHTIFTDVEGLMNNISLVTEFLQKLSDTDVKEDIRNTMVIVPTKKGQSYYFDKETESYYRMYVFVKNSICLQACTNVEDFKKSAKGFSLFTNQLKQFDASKLCEVIPNFHNSKSRFDHFVQAVKADKLGRASFVKDEIDFVLAREKQCSKIVDLLKENKMPLRVTHNDTKLNNILFDKDTLDILCVIDLDTIMPGSLVYDFGDSIRFGCNPAGESERDLSKVVFRKDFFKAFAEGYISNLKDSITKEELDNLAFGGMLMTLECGIRFLDDYLDGDHYFKIHFEDENLVRARTQFRLVEQMEESMDELNSIVSKIFAELN